ncbi:hypothetical protein HKX48_009043 [Thoreauomyces humboldtii]|nr:hypothetical protein HKX48_009043 [Thoreauomyces humboldtii]
MSTLTRYADAHANPKGADDARPSALQIVKDEGLIDKLTDKVFIVTGAASGIGIETARAIHATGARVFIACRDVTRGQAVVDAILRGAEGKGQGKLEVLEINLDSLDSVRNAVDDFKRRSNTLNVLINNAGVMACPEGKTKDGFETQFGTNHLGHFLFFQLLKPLLLASATPEFASRVVSVSSMGHRSSPVLLDDYNFEKRAYDPWVAYGQSKTANIHFANQVERLYGEKNLHALSLHPGGIETPLQRHLDPSFWKKYDNPETRAYMKSTAQGAATTVWAAVGAEWANKGGKYLEDCSVSPAHGTEGINPMLGYAKHAYDPEAEKKLWQLSNRLVGFTETE